MGRDSTQRSGGGGGGRLITGGSGPGGDSSIKCLDVCVGRQKMYSF